MARKREPVDPNPGQRLLGSALKRLRGTNARRSNLALDILTGRTAASALDEPSAPRDTSRARIAGQGGSTIGDPPREAAFPHPGGVASAPRRRGAVMARTVYLSNQDVNDIDFIVRAWRRRANKRVSRSEVLRQAIGNLRDAVELGAAPRILDRDREESTKDG